MRLENAEFDGDPDMVHRLRAFLFALRQFQLDKEKHIIGLKTSGDEMLRRSVEKEMLRRIVRYAAPPIDVVKVAAILYGEDGPHKLAEAQELIDRFTNRPVWN